MPSGATHGASTMVCTASVKLPANSISPARFLLARGRAWETEKGAVTDLSRGPGPTRGASRGAGELLRRRDSGWRPLPALRARGSCPCPAWTGPQPLPVPARTSQPLPVPARTSQPLPVPAGSSQPLPVSAALCPSLPAPALPGSHRGEGGRCRVVPPHL